jgi:DNA helicase MCM9
MCDKYLLSYHRDSIVEILNNLDLNKYFSIKINFLELFENDPNLGNNILKEPEKSLQEWDAALRKIQMDMTSESEGNYTIKKHVHCRIYSLPMFPELHRTKFPQNDDANKFLQVTGTVIRMTSMRMLEFQREYVCTKCKHVMTVNAEYEMKNMIKPPNKCLNPVECKGTNVVSMGDLSPEFCKDYQEIRMQETVNKLDVGSMPTSMWVTLEDDLVDSCKPGDNITVCGVIKRRSKPFVVGKKIEVELVIKANHIQVNNNSSTVSLTPELKDMFQAFWKTYSDRSLAARNIILKSICPQVRTTDGFFVISVLSFSVSSL